MILDKREIGISIKNKARDLGFGLIGFAKVQKLEEQENRLRQWLDKGAHGRMGYMANHFEKRLDPAKLVPGAKSVISLAYNYYTDAKQDPSAPKLSQYAYGEDYHHVLKHKMRMIVEHIRTLTGDFNGRIFVDSAPVLERDWAVRAGIGWMGKNTMLIHPKKGSYFFLVEIICDLELEYDEPMSDHCGRCTRCIDACPTDAISSEGYWMDGSQCISYLTIELRDEIIPEEFKGKMDNWMFGCDICQEVCPWNRFSQEHDEPAFRPKEELMKMTKRDWVEITEDTFKELFKKSAVLRTKFEGLKRNISFLNSGN